MCFMCVSEQCEACPDFEVVKKQSGCCLHPIEKKLENDLYTSLVRSFIHVKQVDNINRFFKKNGFYFYCLLTFYILNYPILCIIYIQSKSFLCILRRTIELVSLSQFRDLVSVK